MTFFFVFEIMGFGQFGLVLILYLSLYYLVNDLVDLHDPSIILYALHISQKRLIIVKRHYKNTKSSLYYFFLKNITKFILE